MKKICLKSLSILVMKAVPKSILIGTQLLWSARSLRLLASGEVRCCYKGRRRQHYDFYIHC